MVTLDNLVVTTALPVIRHDLARDARGPRVDRERVHPHLRRPAPDRRRARRPVRAPAPVRARARRSSPPPPRSAALAPSIEALNVARALQGVGGAIVTPLTLTLLSAAVPANSRGLALGAWGGIGGLAVALGPLVGGAVVSGISWQWIFWLNVPIGLVADPARLAAPGGELRPELEARPAGARPRKRRPARDRLGPRARATASAGARLRSSARSPPAPCSWCCSSSGSCAHRRADAADALLPQPHVRAGERRVAVHVLRDVRLDLPARAVPPDRAGLLAASAPACGSCRGRPCR